MSRLEKLAEAGGAPNITSDSDQVRNKLFELEELLDSVNDNANAIGDAFETQEQVPFEVGTETIAALALIVQALRDTIPELERYAERIATCLYAVDAVRRQQETA